MRRKKKDRRSAQTRGNGDVEAMIMAKKARERKTDGLGDSSVGEETAQ